MQQKRSQLQQNAIQAAKDGDWQLAVECNQALVESEPTDIGALTRLGMAYLQLKNTDAARQAFKDVLKIDKSNGLARKHLDKLAHNQTVPVPAFTNISFIEEPGKTKTVELHRLASKDLLGKLQIGVECELVPKNRYISVEIDGQYVGALPEDLSFRLSKLIGRGNKYMCHIRSVNTGECHVFLREVKRSTKNEYINSFPLNKVNLLTINDIDETFFQEQDIPLTGDEAEMGEIDHEESSTDETE
jgi:tetratricopeptide (TPR) repeat protein